MNIESFRQVMPERTNERTKAFLALLSEPKMPYYKVYTVSKLKVYDKKNCTMVFMINISSHMYGEMILGVFEIFCRGISKKFNLKVHKLQDTFLGTWTRVTCVL